MSEATQRAAAPPIEKWQPFRGPFTRWPFTSDAVLAFLAFVATLAIWASERPDDASAAAPPFFAFVFFLLGNASLFWRRRHPELVHGIVLVASALSIAFAYLDGPIFALAISLYNLGRYTADDRNSYVGVGVAVALLLANELFQSSFATDDLFEMLLPLGIWYAGRRIRARGEYLRLLQERASQLEREQHLEAERAVAEERTRIARELHDIVAHQVSLMTVQAGAAKTVAASDPEAAANAMSAVEKAGRQALDELRHLVGVLRPDSDVGELVPQPGRSDLPRLVEEVERAGVPVALTLNLDDDELPARVDLAIYRIVQEALTNVLKHAGGDARAEVNVSIDNTNVSIEVLDDGTGGTRLPGSGHGIAGMRERAQLLGGTLDSGPRPDGGYSVVATLPLSEEPR